MKTDPEAFSKLICNIGIGEDNYAYVPVLLHIPARKFVDTWLAAPKENWRMISDALRQRYRHQLQDQLVSEKDWITEVQKLMREEAKKIGGLKGARIRRAFPRGLRLPEGK